MLQFLGGFLSIKLEKEVKGSDCYLKMEGNFDEKMSLPAIDETFEVIHFDLKGLRAINSVGIKNWLNWVNSLKTEKFSFSNCPVSFIMQANMVEGFLPQGSSVSSFVVPYYCEVCDEEARHLFSPADVTVENDQVHFNTPHPKCEKGCELELDVNEKKYFKFLSIISKKAAA